MDRCGARALDDIIDNCIRRDPKLRWNIDELSEAVNKLTFQENGLNLNCIVG